MLLTIGLDRQEWSGEPFFSEPLQDMEREIQLQQEQKGVRLNFTVAITVVV